MLVWTLELHSGGPNPLAATSHPSSALAQPVGAEAPAPPISGARKVTGSTFILPSAPRTPHPPARAS